MPRETATSMDIVEDFPPPPPEMLADEVPYADEEEGEQFEFDDSGDEFPEADRSPHAPPAPDYGGKAQINGVAPHPQQEGPDPRPSNTEPTAAAADTDTVAAEPPVPVAMATTDTVVSAPEAPVANATTETTAPVAAAEGDNTSSVPADADSDLPPPPPPEDSTPVGTDSVNTNKEVSSDDPPLAVPRTTSQKKVNPYSVIEITPLQLQQHGAAAWARYSVPVPCGYATPSGVPLITPAYTTPVIIRHFSVDEDVFYMQSY
nr:rho guanine nucleotide exchange factor 10-like [Salvelinus alpinus]